MKSDRCMHAVCRAWAFAAVASFATICEAGFDSLLDLRANERVLIVEVTESPGEERMVRFYEIARGRDDGLYLAASERPGIRGGTLADPEPIVDTQIGATILSAQEAAGLQAYLVFLRRNYEGDAMKTRDIVVGCYRNREKVSEERFRDATPYLDFFHRIDGEVVVGEDMGPPDFPADVFESIVPPRLIEERIREEAAGKAALP